MAITLYDKRQLKNIAAHLEGPLADRPGGWRPLVYCWRGGQRSGTFGWLMREIGWRAETLVGGYRTWRRLVVGDNMWYRAGLYRALKRWQRFRGDGYVADAENTAKYAEYVKLFSGR